MKVLIFGGKFNPLHNGHIKIIQEITQTLDFDQVWLLPSGLKKEQLVMQPSSRLLIIENFASKHNYIIKKNEMNLGYEKPTIKTIKELKQEFDYDFHFLIGTDQVNNFHLWDDAQELAKEVKFVATQRKGYSLKSSNIEKYNMTIVDSDAPKISSTEIRRGDLQHLNSFTQKTLISDTIFLESIVKKWLSPKRAQHSINVGKKAVELGKKYLPNKIEQLYIAGLFHDITKEWTKDEHKEFISPKTLKEHENTWHQNSGAAFLKKKLKIMDEEILSSIRKHTTAAKEMTTFDKVVYCADKISHERQYEEVDDLRKICEADLDKCFLECFKASHTLIDRKQIKLSKNIKQIKDKWYEE